MENTATRVVHGQGPIRLLFGEGFIRAMAPYRSTVRRHMEILTVPYCWVRSEASIALSLSIAEAISIAA